MSPGIPSNEVSGSRIAVDTLVWLIEDAFQSDPSHSIIANLKGLKKEEWTALPADPSQRRLPRSAGWKGVMRLFWL